MKKKISQMNNLIKDIVNKDIKKRKKKKNLILLLYFYNLDTINLRININFYKKLKKMK
jgi:hypothetical protein